MRKEMQERNIQIQEEYMNKDNPIDIVNVLQLKMLWTQYCKWDIQIVSNWNDTQHIIKIFDEKGKLLNGWLLQSADKD